MSVGLILEEKSDIELYTQFLNGNNAAFNTIATRYHKKLVDFIMKYVHNVDAAEDLAQDTFVYVLANRKEYDFKYTLKTYLFTIAKCRALNYIKKQKRNINVDDDYFWDINNAANIAEEIKVEESKDLVKEAMKKLKQEYQIAIYLSEFQGFQYKEICKILNKTMPQTKMLIHRAKNELRKILGKEKNIC